MILRAYYSRWTAAVARARSDPRPCRGRSSPVAAAAAPSQPSDINAPAPGRVEFVAEAKDLESDEAIWALYERWCVAFGQERSRDEMARRFSVFKENALLVDRTNRANLPYWLGINDMADGKLAERRGLKTPRSSLDEMKTMHMRRFSHRRPISSDEPE